MRTDCGFEVKKMSSLAAIVVAAAVMMAQSPAPVSGPMLSFTATTDNVAGAPDTVRIDLLRWSTDAERAQLLSAWNMTNVAAQGGRGGGRGGRGGAGRGGRAAAPAPDPAAEDGLAAAPPARSGRGVAEEAPRPTPESTLAAALKQATTVGYLWSSEIAGYALRYAGKAPGPDGLDRIILITDRRLGATNDLWNPVGAAAPSTYGFSVIELRVNSKAEGEGKISLTGKVALDSAAKIVVPENYGALPVVLKNLKSRTRDGH
jgi:hypothetical protein